MDATAEMPVAVSPVQQRMAPPSRFWRSGIRVAHTRNGIRRSRAGHPDRVGVVGWIFTGHQKIRFFISSLRPPGIRSQNNSVALPFIFGTLVSSAIALIIAVPLGIATAA